ncbi:protein kinase [Streptomyces sp. NPDC048506]|uniref:protein kinase domain-containing protein n=1 Tax=Streptomyces sp. NPDC048506 TaxID=3155028 RepID=UPI0034176142
MAGGGIRPLGGDDPQRLGPYQLLGRLGSGGMGRIYLARSAADDALVAVKTLLAEGVVSDTDRRRFAREVKLARRIDSAYTARVRDADPDAERPWMAIEYIPAPALSELVRRAGRLPGPAVYWIAAGSAQALMALHDEKIVHRDVKPQNILLPLSGPRLIDFGISHANDLTRTSLTLGTIAFTSPEQARAEPSTPASDVYALGATLFHLAVGRPPYPDTEDTIRLLALVQRGELDLAGLPEDLAPLIRPCLAVDPSERPGPSALLLRCRQELDGPPTFRRDAQRLPARWTRLIEEYAAHGRALREGDSAPAPPIDGVTQPVPPPKPTRVYTWARATNVLEANKQRWERQERERREPRERERQAREAREWKARAERVRKAGEERDRQQRAAQAGPRKGAQGRAAQARKQVPQAPKKAVQGPKQAAQAPKKTPQGPKKTPPAPKRVAPAPKKAVTSPKKSSGDGGCLGWAVLAAVVALFFWHPWNSDSTSGSSGGPSSGPSPSSAYSTGGLGTLTTGGSATGGSSTSGGSGPSTDTYGSSSGGGSSGASGSSTGGGSDTSPTPSASPTRSATDQAFASVRAGDCLDAYQNGYGDWSRAAPEEVGCGAVNAYLRVLTARDGPAVCSIGRGRGSWRHTADDSSSTTLCVERQFRTGQCFLAKASGSQPGSANLLTMWSCNATKVPRGFNYIMQVTAVMSASSGTNACPAEAGRYRYSWNVYDGGTMICAKVA